jgi:hypothetical protein
MDPGAPSGADPLDQARADLAGDADPYGEVPDAGDFGLPTVDAPPAPAPVAVAEPSYGQDSYMDQPDVGSTSSLAGEPYGDATDDVANEYSA